MLFEGGCHLEGVLCDTLRFGVRRNEVLAYEFPAMQYVTLDILLHMCRRLIHIVNSRCSPVLIVELLNNTSPFELP